MEKNNEVTVIQMRQAEIDLYSQNIKNYENLLSTINGNWDEKLIHLKGIEVQEAAKQCNIEDLERLAELQLYDQVENLLKTEIVERFKSQTILNSLLNS